MKSKPPPSPETDPRFPSGPWTGFYLHRQIPGKHQMELLLSFSDGIMKGEGRDSIGAFLIHGKYTLADGKCHFTKRYIGKHDVFYQGFNEGKGIWGAWEIRASRNSLGARGGFHIWPEGMGDPTQQQLTEAAELPITQSEPLPVEEPVAAPVGRKR